VDKKVSPVEIVKKKLEYVVAFAVAAFFILLSLTPAIEKIDYILYDALLAIKPEIPERPEILLLNIDDGAIEEVGAWPWSRDVMAEVLIRMREGGATTAVFDIEYLNPGQTGVNPDYVKTRLPEEYQGMRREITENLSLFAKAIADRSIPASAADEYGNELVAYVDPLMGDVYGSITSNIFRDNDKYFASALRFFGNAYLTVNSNELNKNEDAVEATAFALERFLRSDVVDPAGRIKRDNERTRKESQSIVVYGITPAIRPLLEGARGLGFPNVVVDSDGVRRRIELLAEYEGHYAPQLVLAPILDVLEPSKIVRKANRLVLVGARDPKNPSSPARRDISIPLDRKGRLLINWLKRPFDASGDSDAAANKRDRSFRQMGAYSLIFLDRVEASLIEKLGLFADLSVRDASGFLGYHDAALYLKSRYADLARWRAGLIAGERDDHESYFADRKIFFSEYGQFLDGGFDTELYETIERVRAATGTDKYDETLGFIRQLFEKSREDYAIYLSGWERASRELSGAFCVIGHTATGSTDLGINPFAKSYANVGTHANIYNTIMTGEYITPLPRWASWLVALAFCYLVALAFRKIGTLGWRLVGGLVATVLVFCVVALLFSVPRVYVELFVPLLSVFVSFLLISILRFIFSEQEKSFLRKAFTMYLSSDVVDEIVEDPSILRLGGQEKRITALFTDIKSFSSLSEKVSPERLVEILNRYLTVMSDIVLEQKGTIDKYIGDAIVSFFGAPLDLPDHATRACLAAVRMKEAERDLNAELYETGQIPMPILTRIGINTGAMVVGNMGTNNKMNYTIMGNDVNLAARLEGVNKQYGTWTLVSESTWNETGGLFLGRKLDRVRVVGIETPVQLYNLMGVRSEADDRSIELAERFNAAIDLYRARKFSDAAVAFAKCAELDPEDGASRAFLERVRGMTKAGVADGWTDVLTMTTK